MYDVHCQQKLATLQTRDRCAKFKNTQFLKLNFFILILLISNLTFCQNNTDSLIVALPNFQNFWVVKYGILNLQLCNKKYSQV